MDLNHAKVIHFGKNQSALDLPNYLEKFVFANSRPDIFAYWVEPPERGWTCFVPETVEIAYPLWSCNADQTLLLMEQSGNWFGQGHHDDPDIYFLGHTPQGLYASLFIQLCGTDATDDELREAARFCGFRHIEETFRFLESSSASRAWEKAKNDFISDIDQTSGWT